MLSRTLGAFLAYYHVRCQPDENLGLGELTRQIASVTRPIKAGRRYLDSLASMKLVEKLWPWFSEATRPHIAGKVLPMTGGVSNVLLRKPWIDANRNRILGYSRAAPTGPMLPLVLTPTTLGEQMNIGVTYRVTGFCQAKIDAIMEALLDQIENRPADFRLVHPWSDRGAGITIGGGPSDDVGRSSLVGCGS